MTGQQQHDWSPLAWVHAAGREALESSSAVLQTAAKTISATSPNEKARHLLMTPAHTWIDAHDGGWFAERFMIFLIGEIRGINVRSLLRCRRGAGPLADDAIWVE
jgi:hypothetical protein